MQLTIRETGVDKVERRFKVFGERLADPRPALRLALDKIEDANYQRIETGKGIRRDTKATTARKKREGSDLTPLRESGALLASMRRGGRGNIFKVYRTVGRYGTDLPHAHLQFTRKTVKARRVVTIQKTTRQKAKLAVRDELFEPMR